MCAAHGVRTDMAKHKAAAPKTASKTKAAAKTAIKTKTTIKSAASKASGM